ncbi:MAG: bifunctional adenosylcobinamide kinase/adenosylcobinamide-phosphate guanylyltransferase [Lachnospiraceae bacterium]|nr:bifunctional adenosylcobinamide kinase/adenosylcobinamide-phosphate guanylyltransferase [Lachnospiraceae bacterium]
MMVLVIGGSGSGKSAYAERLTDDLMKIADAEGKADEHGCTAECRKYYFATMKVFDEEGRKKVERHRSLRSGKGFDTVEQSTDIHKAVEKMGAGERIVLLECLSNLTANEMFSGEEPAAAGQVVEKIMRGLEALKAQTTQLIVVTNNVFEDGIVYEEATMEYIWAMGKLNRRLADLADQVVEVVAGIPVVIK